MKPPVFTDTPRREKNESQIQHEEKVFGPDGNEFPEGTEIVGTKDYVVGENGLEEIDPRGFQPAPAAVMPMFTTPFLRGGLNLDTQEVAQSCRDLVSKVKKGDVTTEYTTYFNEDLRTEMHETEWFKSFSNQIKDTYICFCSNVFNQPTKHLCRDDIHLFAWINHYTGPHQHGIHNHVNSHMSGTYFITDSIQPIKFTSPNFLELANHQAVDRDIEREGFNNILFSGVEGCDSAFSYFPVKNEFLLWPSYIMHSVEPMYHLPDDYERISISFNLKHRLPIDNNQTGDNMEYEQYIQEDVNHDR